MPGERTENAGEGPTWEGSVYDDNPGGIMEQGDEHVM